MINKHNTRWIFCLSVLVCGWAVYSVLVSPPLLHGEGRIYLSHYLDDRPLMAKVFDVYKNEQGTYVARELSYLFDYLDAKGVEFLFGLGIFSFASPMHYLLTSFLIIFSYLFLFAGGCRGKKLLFVVVTCLLLSAPSAQIAYYFRTAKILTATFGVILYVMSSRLFRVHAELELKKSAAIVFVALMLCLSDRQGFFICVSFALVLLCLFLAKNEKNYLLISASCFFSALIASLYNHFLGPNIILFTQGYLPSDDYQNINWSLIGPKQHVYPAISVFFSQVAFFFGNTGHGIVIAALVLVLVVVFSNKHKQDVSKRIDGVIVFVAFCVCSIIMISIMIYKHSPVLWPDLQRTYYWLPLTYLLYILFADLVVNKLNFDRGSLRLATCVVFVLVAMNMYGLEKHYAIFRSGHLSNSISATHKMIVCIGDREKQIRLNGRYSVKNALNLCY